MTLYGDMANPKKTPQGERARTDQIENNAGGFVFAVDAWKRLDRFLVLGAAGGTYYVSERKHVIENIACVAECLALDGPRAVARAVEISDAGRAPKNDPAIFLLAQAAASKDAVTRAAALAALPKICRIGTHLFHFAADVNNARGWGRALKKAVALWYTGRSSDQLAFQAVKYQQRDGWSHKDLLRLAHPKPPTPSHDAAFRWIMGGVNAVREEPAKRRKVMHPDALPTIIEAFVAVHAALTVKEVVRLIEMHHLPHEAIPNQWKNAPEVWSAMLSSMGLTAIIRNLGKMTSIELVKPLSVATKIIAQGLTDRKELKQQRVHPMTILLAGAVYKQGHGDKGKLSWTPVPAIVEALDEAFHLAFEAVVPSGKNHLVALDVSGSMGSPIAGSSLSCREGAAAVALVTARTEPWTHIVAFSAASRGHGGQWGGGTSGMTEVAFTGKTRLSDALAETQRIKMGGTDCSLPMLYAIEKKLEVDLFTVITDNETWAGNIHPYQALKQYREKMQRPARLAVVAMEANEFTIADPTDAGMLDVVGFDTATPAVLSAFSKGEI